MIQDQQTIPVLVLSGTCGAGKTSIGETVHELLAARGISSAFLDIDALTNFWPPVGRFNSELMLASLTQLWPLYKQFGAARVILAHVIETREELRALADVLDGGQVTLVRVTAAESTRKARITARDMGESRDWHLARTVELEAILEAAALENFTVVNSSSVEVAANTVLRLWEEALARH